MKRTTQELTVMVVDDVRTIRARVAASLAAQHCYKVIQAENGNDAIKKITLHKPDIVIMDIHMPDMTGIECIKILKRMPFLRHTRYLVLTADSDFKRVVEAYDVGCTDYIDKSQLDTDLISKLKKAEKMIRMTSNVHSLVGDHL